MKTLLLLQALLFSSPVFAQTDKGLPHGTTFGAKPDTTAIVTAPKLEAFMAQKTRITIAIKGRVIKVTKQKGGWFELDAGNGKVIAAHFKDYNINIPADIKGHIVIVAGVAQKQFIADDQQHFAGDTVTGKKQHNVRVNPKHRLTFEATGLTVD